MYNAAQNGMIMFKGTRSQRKNNAQKAITQNLQVLSDLSRGCIIGGIGLCTDNAAINPTNNHRNIPDETNLNETHIKLCESMPINEESNPSR
jgi:predicted peroxiredoxin